jgi:uncharacterized protein (DUF427 family)
MQKQKITIKKLSATWYVRAGSKILGRSRNVLQLTEGVHKPVLYFPRDDLNMALFTKTDHSTHCPYKGDASYFTVSGDLENAAWSYETPIDDVLEIKGHIAFYTDRIQLEEH